MGKEKWKQETSIINGKEKQENPTDGFVFIYFHTVSNHKFLPPAKHQYIVCGLSHDYWASYIVRSKKILFILVS